MFGIWQPSRQDIKFVAYIPQTTDEFVPVIGYIHF